MIWILLTSLLPIPTVYAGIGDIYFCEVTGLIVISLLLFLPKNTAWRQPMLVSQFLAHEQRSQMSDTSHLMIHRSQTKYLVRSPLFRQYLKVRGLLSQMGMDDRLKGEGAPPDHGGAGLEPWTFRVGLVNSFGGCLAWPCMIGTNPLLKSIK